MGIVKKGKARVEKSGVPEADLDSDEIMLQTVAAGINMYVTFGGPSEAEKAWDLTLHLERWLNHHDSESSSDLQIMDSPSTPSQEQQVENKLTASHGALYTVCRAIGIGHAHWGRTTYDSSKRNDLQKNAVENLRKALRHIPSGEDAETLYSLALVLAEMREIEGAIATVKEALSGKPAHPVENDRQITDITKRDTNGSSSKTRINEWHLLTLLLSARQEFDTAEASCEAALEESGFAQEASQILSLERDADITLFRKQYIIEVKMTQLALAEVTDGPEIAVNTSGELLELYASFFSSTKSELKLPAPTLSPLGPTSNGTVRSFRSSVFGRSKDAKGSLRTTTAAESIRSQRHSDDLLHPPTISITHSEQAMHEQLSPPSSSQSHHVFRHTSKRLQKRNSMRSILSRTASPSRAVSAGPGSAPPSTAAKYSASDRILSDSAAYRPGSSESLTRGQVGVAMSPNLQTIPASPMPRGEGFSYDPQPTTSSHQEFTKSGQQNTTFTQATSSQPIPRTHFHAPVSPILSEVDRQRHATSLLLKIWIFIAGLYRRAKLYDDAQEAVGEAFKQVKLAEVSVASHESSVRAFELPAWGGAKSVEELWADAYTERGNICLAQSLPHEALIEYESALSHDPDHPSATIGLSNILLDIYSQTSPQPQEKFSEPLGSGSGATRSKKAPQPILASVSTPLSNGHLSVSVGVQNTYDSPFPNGSNSSSATDSPLPKTKPPEVLDRLEARDRAYGLLSSLTKLGKGWDNSEAWFTLARAYEESGQMERAKEVLWWVVELEEKRPIRGWECLGRGYGL